MSKIKNLEQLLVDELRDLYNAENQLIKALPKMAKAATDGKLKAGFTEHLAQTRGHVVRLEEALKVLEASPKGKTCHAMAGLVEEGAEAIETDGPAAVRDANLIGAAQRVEHYEIAAYGTARAFAVALEQDEIVALLSSTLAEESATDQKLTVLAKGVNAAAIAGSRDREEKEG